MIPAGADAQQGAYVSYASRELHALVSLEAHRAGAVVVGEDLGTVPPEVRQRMAADRMLRSWVFQFETSTEHPLPAPPRRVLASPGTHDLPRFAAFIWGTDIDQEEEAGHVSAKEASAQRAERQLYRVALFEAVAVADLTTSEATRAALRACLNHLAASAADLVLVDLEELWGERQPQNRPGTGTEADNWRRRGACTLAEAKADERIKNLLTDIDQLRSGAMR
jgi:4-alpha-glucanotransferase